MSAMERRLERLYPALSAKERAILVLKAWKEGKEPDLAVRFSMPLEQTGEYNHLLGLMTRANFDLGWYIALQGRAVAELHARYCWLLACRLWSLRSSMIADYIGLHTKEPITESEYRKLSARRRRGAPKPQWGAGYEVHPGDQEAEISRLRRAREKALAGLLAVPFPDQILLPEPKGKAQRERVSMWREMGAQLERQVVEGIQQRWREIRAVEIVLEEARAKFGGEDPLRPVLREALEDAKGKVQELAEAMRWAVGELPEPDESLLRAVRGLLERGRG